MAGSSPSRAVASPDGAADPAALFQAQRRRLFGLAYRLTGSADDADDVVQETFARWLERPEADAGEPSGPWLVRVATRLGIDALRARRRRIYPGPWLPSPIEGADEAGPEAGPLTTVDPEARYGLLESVTLAFLVALEALAPRPRAVLLLRDVLGYPALEVAEILGTTEGNVRVLHLRARRAMAAYDGRRCIPTPEARARHRAALEDLLRSLLAQDGRALEALLAESVRTTTDAGGEYAALRAPLAGRERVARFYLQAALNRAAGGPSVEIRIVNGLPAAVISLARPVRRQAPLGVMWLEVGRDGRVVEIRTVLATAKVARLRAASAPRPA